MGHLLGAPPRRTGSRANPVSAGSPLDCMPPGSEVDSLDLHSPDPAAVTAFAIDQPRPGDRSRGLGLEVNGWIIGRDEPLQGVRISSLGSSKRPLSARGAAPGRGGGLPRATQMRAPPDFRRGRRSTLVSDVWRIDVEVFWPTGEPSESPRSGGNSAAEPNIPSPGNRTITAPDFVIIGTQRGGTTSLHAYLSAHPQVATPATKELHFITDRYERGLDWYLGQFPAELPPDVITGEATPYALFHPLAPRRLREIAPAARLIVLLRNPVDRAYSHYLLERVPRRRDVGLRRRARCRTGAAGGRRSTAGARPRVRKRPSQARQLHGEG